MKKEYVTPDVEKFEFEVPTLLQTEGEGGSVKVGGEGNPEDEVD